MIPNTRLFTAMAAGALVLMAGSAQAQPQGAPTAGGPRQMDLSAALHLRPDQQQAYRAFQAASQPSPDEISVFRGATSQALAGLTTPQRLDRVGARLRAQLDVFQRQASATRTFYGQLSPDQQRTFDQVTGPPANRGRPQ